MRDATTRSNTKSVPFGLKQTHLVGLALGFFLFLVNGCSFFQDINQKLRSDTELEAVFRSDKADFEKIVQMAKSDSKVPRIAYDFTWVVGAGSSSDSGDPGISNSRWEEYKRLFRKLRLEGGINREEDGSVAFFASSLGISVSGISKGYLFTKTDRGCSATSLDDLEKYRDRHFICKRIDEDWYLYVMK